MGDRHLIFVLGMHRSGTSAMTRIASEFGNVALPPDLLGASYSNRWGHWEPRRSLMLNDRFLAQFGSAAFDPGFEVQLGAVVSPEQAEEFQREIAAFLSELFRSSDSIIVKDPRISVVVDHWVRAAEKVGCRVSAIYMFRHPAQVAASLFDRDQLSLEFGKALWLKYNLVCERQSRGLKRVFVEFDELQNDWRATLERVSDSLALNFSLDDRKVDFIEGFLDRGARRSPPPPFADAITEQWCRFVYQWLRSAVAGVRVDSPAMDRCLADVSDVGKMYRESYRDYVARFKPKVETARIESELRQLREQMSLYEDVLLDKFRMGEKFGRILERIRTSSAVTDPSVPNSFNAIRYVTRYPDLFDAEVDPYRHYADFGASEGRRWSSEPETLQASEVLQSMEETLSRYEAILRADPYPANVFARILPKILPTANHGSEVPPEFNPIRYLLRYPDLFYAEVDPFEHFINHGVAEGRKWDFGAAA